MKNLTFIAVFLSLAVTSPAQDSSEQIVQKAILDHPKVKAAQAAIEAERAGKSEMLSPFRPMASANGYLAGGNGSMVFPSTVEPINFAMLPPDGVAMGNLTLMWKVWTGGRDATARRLGDAKIRAAQEMLATVQQDVALAVRVAFAAYVYQVDALEAAKAELAAALEMERTTIELEKNGKAPRAFVLRATATVKAAEREVAMSEAAARMAKADLDEAAGFPVNVAVSNAQAIEVPDDLASALQAGADRSELRFMLAMAESMGLEAEAVKRSLLPEVSLMAMGGTAQTSRGESMTDAKFGLVFSVPLTDGGMRSSRAAVFRARAQELLAQAEEMRLTVRKEIESAWAEWTAGAPVTDSAQAGLAAATEAYEVERLRYENGRATVAELLDTLSALTRAKLDVIDAHRFSSIAGARIQRAIGLVTAG
jgi:outer membrane protein